MASFGDQVAAEESKIEQAMGARLEAIKAERKRQLEARKKELIESGTGNVAGELAKMKLQLESEMGDMEGALMREQHQQLAKLRKAKLNRRMAKEKKRRQREAEAAQETARQQAKIELQTKMTKRMQSIAQGKKVDMSEIAEAEDLLRILLRKWSENIGGSGDLHVWEKEAGAGPAIEVENAEGNSPGLNESHASIHLAKEAETGVIGGDRQAQEFSVAELFRRLRRIEKLTRLIKEKEDQKASGSQPRLNLAFL